MHASRSECRHIANTAGVGDVRTVIKYLDGGNLHRTTRMAIEHALRSLGLEHLVRADDPVARLRMSVSTKERSM